MKRLFSRLFLLGALWGAASCAPETEQVSSTSSAVVLAPKWTATGDGSGARDDHVAVKLNDGKVLVVYGNSCGGGCLLAPGARLFDPETNNFTSTGNPPDRGVGATSVLLPNGKALIAGRLLYDPALGEFASTGPFTCTSCATLTLPNGKVLFVGGESLLYNAATNGSEATGPMTVSRPGASAALLASGKVLVTGGGGLASAEIYDPKANTFTASKGSLSEPFDGHSSFTLASGKVLILSANGAQAELYDPKKDSFSVTGALQQARDHFDATQLESGAVLVVGGFIGAAATTSVERYEPSVGKFVSAPLLRTARGYHRVTLLDDGSVLATFGRNLNNNGQGSSMSDAERLTFAKPGGECLANEHCRTGICDEGVCCVSECEGTCHACSLGSGKCEVVTDADDPDTCRGESTCNADGECKKRLAEPCADGAECGSGFCTDGYCCDQACDGTCEACDGLARGACSAIAGPPHGERACSGSSGLCAGACDGDQREACIYPTESTGCGTSCADGERIASACDGQGECAPQTARPCPGNFSCADEASCKTSCEDDDGCTDGFACVDSACVPTARCDGDHTIFAADGKTTTDCAPFKCNEKNRCKTSCESVADCANPFVCDASGTCVAAVKSEPSDGCNLARGPQHGSAVLALLVALALRRRRQNA